MQATADGPNPASHIFNFNLWHSLGYLNQHPWTSATPNGWLPAGITTPPYGTYYTSAAAPLPSMAGALQPTANVPSGVAPSQPVFPWLTWNNRPYVSPLELALVPKSRSSRLLADYSTQNLTQTAAAAIYQTQSATAMAGATYTHSPYFGHLLNFFDASSPTLGGNLNLYRLFEYVQVPSKFVGTEAVLPPTDYIAPTYNEGAFWTYLRPPFNRVSEFRDPGKININTVADPVVWQGLLGINPNTSPLINPAFTPPLLPGVSGAPDVATSRQGYSTPGGTPNPSYPSYFANPFRSFAGAALTNSIYTNISTPLQARRDIDVTLLRPGAVNSSASPPLFDYQGFANGTSTTADYNDPSRSPYFRIQNASRAMNLLTTRSNVYAVWITVGYFQVTPIAASTVYPDGYQLGAEVGSDTGEIKRHRAFYIIDRTIPVGFQRGEDLNSENAILLRRVIE